MGDFFLFLSSRYQYAYFTQWVWVAKLLVRLIGKLTSMDCNTCSWWVPEFESLTGHTTFIEIYSLPTSDSRMAAVSY